MYLSNYLCLFVLVACADSQILNRFRRMGKPSAMKLKQRLQDKIIQYRERNTQTICYDTVGCFELPHKRSPLQKTPENPDMLNTRFYLLTRQTNFSQPEILYYDDDGNSVENSKFDHSKPVKMFVHGYMGKWNDTGNLLAAESYLKIYDCNMVLMDWSVGARGPQYATAAANTELVGRQLGLLLMEMIKKGLDPKNIHIIGFSLGAHVAGSASEVLKKKKHLIGRITGLDAASPLFRTNHFREKYKKLDKEDASFVDVVHTDASPYATDGFGLWEPIGHVDFFPNGGQQQPGCTDQRQSVVALHFDRSGGLTSETACSHLRAYRLFQETLSYKAANASDCVFTAYSCPGGLKSFEKGFCFPNLPKANSSLFMDASYRSEVGKFGEDYKGEGVMFFVTRAASPFCGTQIQASVYISPRTVPIRGLIILSLRYLHHSVDFQILCETDDFILSGTVMSGLEAVLYKSLDNVANIEATIKFIDLQSEDENNNTYVPLLFVDKIMVRDMYRNTWQFCKKETAIGNIDGVYTDFNMTLSRNNIC